MRKYGNLLSQFEKQEIHRFNEVYYLGTLDAKEQRKYKSVFCTKDNNNGFDRNGGFYKMFVGDHVFYRYEIL